MKQKLGILFSVLLVLILVLTGYGDSFWHHLDNTLGGGQEVAYRDMQYTRPDLAQLQQVLQDSVMAVSHAENLEQTLQAVYDFNSAYDDYVTNYNLADIRYSADLTDAYWQEEYGFCSENLSVANSSLDELYRALADSPFREELEQEDYFGDGFFDAYEGESYWDEGFLALTQREADLQAQYYALSEEALAEPYYSEAYFTRYGSRMAQIYVDLIGVRQEMAAYLGYGSYPEFAYDFYHYRDYTPKQAVSYLEEIGRELVPLYRQVNGAMDWSYSQCSTEQTFQYVKNAAGKMGGSVQEAFACLDRLGVYDISPGEHKYNSSFEVYLNSYSVPFVFLNPSMDSGDQLTFAHEFGHFCNDYVCGGSYAGTDVAEVHSQAMEYLSLCLTPDAGELETRKLADCLYLYVEQAAYSLFEHQVYSLTGDELTVENVQALYESICLDYGFDAWSFDSRDFCTITHLYTAPLYMVSYVTSNDLAFQLYQMEKETPGSGVEVYKKCLQSQDTYLLAFAQAYGLEDPMTAQRVRQVRQTLETLFG